MGAGKLIKLNREIRYNVFMVRMSVNPKAKRKTVSERQRFTALKTKVTPLLRPYASRISVFGSYARGEMTASSDIDILIALKPANARPALGLFGFIALEQNLAKKLGRRVDLVTEESINPRRRKSIQQDKVVLYEAK